MKEAVEGVTGFLVLQLLGVAGAALAGVVARFGGGLLLLAALLGALRLREARGDALAAEPFGVEDFAFFGDPVLPELVLRFGGAIYLFGGLSWVV